MVMCKFFLQGTCRFGNSCKFDHQITSDNNFGSGQSILLHNYGAKPQQQTQQQLQQQQTPAGSNVDTNTIIKVVVNDMTLAEKGGQWLLSTYSPFKEKPQFPGFEDHSMEEIRFLFLEAVKTGTVEQYKQNLQMMLQQAMMKIKALQNPTPDAVNILKQIYNNPGVGGTVQNQPSSNVFGGNTANTSSIFGGGGGANQTTPFGAQHQQSSIFGGATTNVFQSQPPANNTGSIFGVQAASQGSATNIFGGQPQNSSIFGGGGSSIFGGNQAVASVAPPAFQGAQINPNSQNIFGGGIAQQTIFGPPQQSVFGVQQAQVVQPQSIFGGVQQPSQQQMQPQVQPQQAMNVFQQQTSILIQPQQSQQPPVNIFQHQQQQIPQINMGFGTLASTHQQSLQVQNHSSSIFGGTPGAPPNVSANNFGGGGAPRPPHPDDECYSKLSDLTQEEIDWFQSDDLDISKIPEKPPTFEMCFKSC